MASVRSLCFVAVLIWGCGEAHTSTDPFDSPSMCSSGITRSPNESESPEMGPGRACNACHANSNSASGEGDAPIFAFAGTVYSTAHEPDDCVGSSMEGAIVEITDADGQVFRESLNRSGNFLADEPKFRYPYTAKIIFQGREREMLLEQTSGDCNSCHTEAGDQGAPGRILLP